MPHIINDFFEIVNTLFTRIGKFNFFRENRVGERLVGFLCRLCMSAKKRNSDLIFSMITFKPTSFKVIDLFCGCGLSLGLQNAGFNIIAEFDHSKTIF
ncbi:MAG: hypothetical protein ACKPEN_17940 [Planktothrix sp.]